MISRGRGRGDRPKSPSTAQRSPEEKEVPALLPLLLMKVNVDDVPLILLRQTRHFSQPMKRAGSVKSFTTTEKYHS